MLSFVRTAPEPKLVEERLDFLDSWARWRHACEDLRAAYEYWRGCLRAQRPLAFAHYRAALDWEEHAARVHAQSAERLFADH
jgi:hypothetical protein